MSEHHPRLNVLTVTAVLNAAGDRLTVTAGASELFVQAMSREERQRWGRLLKQLSDLAGPVLRRLDERGWTNDGAGPGQ